MQGWGRGVALVSLGGGEGRSGGECLVLLRLGRAGEGVEGSSGLRGGLVLLGLGCAAGACLGWKALGAGRLGGA